jgi:hypothetical protein
MSYIGNIPAESYSAFQKQDFTTSATTSYTLDHPVANQNELALFINFVRQEPTAAYTASGTSLTLTSATSVGDDMYCVYLGKAVQTVNPPSGSVGASQLASDAVTTAKILDANVTAAKLASGVLPTNTPAFFAHSASDQGSVSDNTYTKVTLGTEVFDTASAFASSKFTVPSGEAGKYFLYGSVRNQVGSNSDMNQAYSAIYLNGSIYIENRMDFQANPVKISTNLIHVVMDLSVGDYVELYAAVDHAGSYGIEIGTGEKGTNFGGYKIIE